MAAGGFNLVNSLLFPVPESSYDLDDFPEELIWVPRTLDPTTSSPEDCVPCLLLPSPSARFFILYLHGNAEDLGRCYSFCSLLRYQFQVHVLAVEYPAYGICPGQASEAAVIENAFVGFRFLTQVLGWAADEILVFGRSIGCGPALALAAHYHVYGVILVCPFLSVKELCKDFIGPLAHMVEERFPNKDRIKQITSSLLLVHGKQDTVVPWTHGRALYDECRTRKRFVSPEDMSHNSNLHADPSYFVLPMLQFFGLPDYSFEEMRVPDWAYDKRLCPRFRGSGFPSRAKVRETGEFRRSRRVTSPMRIRQPPAATSDVPVSWPSADVSTATPPEGSGKEINSVRAAQEEEDRKMEDAATDMVQRFLERRYMRKKQAAGPWQRQAARQASPGAITQLRRQTLPNSDAGPDINGGDAAAGGTRMLQAPVQARPLVTLPALPPRGPETWRDLESVPEVFGERLEDDSGSESEASHTAAGDDLPQAPDDSGFFKVPRSRQVAPAVWSGPALVPTRGAPADGVGGLAQVLAGLLPGCLTSCTSPSSPAIQGR